jgi:uncharacterized RDD family membrane protein YckC
MATVTQSRPSVETPQPPQKKHVRYVLHPVGVRVRGVALLIDTLIMATLGGSLTFWFHKLPVLQAGVFLSLYLAYFIVMEAVWGATLGKMAVGLKVVKLDGSSITWKQAYLRNLFRLVDGLCFYLVGILCILSSPSKQRYGDRMAHTVVILIRTRKPRPVEPVDDWDE